MPLSRVTFTGPMPPLCFFVCQGLNPDSYMLLTTELYASLVYTFS